MNDTGKRIYLIVIWVITLFAVLFGIYRFVGTGHGNVFSFGKGNTVTKTADLASDVTELDVDIEAGNVIIEEGDEPAVTYTFSEKADIDISQDNGKVTFKQNGDDYSMFSFGNVKRQVTITVPRERQLARISTKIDAGNVDINNIKCNDMEILLDAGNLKINNATARNLTAEVDSGNITVKGDIENIDATVDMGNIDINGNTDSINAEVDMGNISADGNIRSIDTMVNAGNITLKGSLNAVTATVDAGSININSDKSESEMTLKLDAGLGKITVNGKDYKV